MRLILLSLLILKGRSALEHIPEIFGRTHKSAPAFRCLLASLIGFFCLTCAAHAAPRPVTIGALAYGTLNWELTVIDREGLDRRYGFKLDVRKLANPQAGRIALQAGSVDLIVTDWL
ncbi:MAG: hypothetical protein JXR29_02820, partial [Methylothermaceae bacterium]|nr:hypothetical protein [Methylothermaceae bacterium]